jgi:hypothetical protein
VRVWETRYISNKDTLLISLILAGIALTKLTGVSLFAVVYLTLIAGIWQARWSWQDVARVISISLIATALFAGWWYVRNWQLYGDPLALKATASIWGRGTPLTVPVFAEELVRIGKTFWMMVGYLHNPVLAPNWFYFYTAFATVGAIIGLILYWRDYGRSTYWIFVLALVVVAGMLFYGTLSVDISYGRLLFPAIAAFAPFFVVGWKRLLGNYMLVILIPIIYVAYFAPQNFLSIAYPTLHPVQGVPASATPVHWVTKWYPESFEIVAVDVPRKPVTSGDSLHVDVYIRGTYPINTSLRATAIDSVRVDRLDYVEIFPAMGGTDALGDSVYRIPVDFQLKQPGVIRSPRLVVVNIEWYNNQYDTLINYENGRSLVEIQGPVFYDPRYHVSELPMKPEPNRFADEGELQLQSYNMPQSLRVGNSFDMQFIWQTRQPLSQNWTLTIQLFKVTDESTASTSSAQSDGILWWYPTSEWLTDKAFEDTRTIELSANIEPGDYEIRVGWYRPDNGNFVRMPVTQGEHVDNLLILPTRLTIQGN